MSSHGIICSRSQTMFFALHCLPSIQNHSRYTLDSQFLLADPLFSFSCGYQWPISTENNHWAGEHREGLFPAGKVAPSLGTALLLHFPCPRAGSLLFSSHSCTCRGQWVPPHVSSPSARLGKDQEAEALEYYPTTLFLCDFSCISARSHSGYPLNILSNMFYCQSIQLVA